MKKLKIEHRIFLRSLLWQASWNFARMQCLGLAYSIYPLLEKLYGDDDKKLTERLRRYLVCFNTNPYLGAAILGFLVHMESRGEEMGDQGLALSGNLAGLYGAVGDNFFWSGLKPMVSSLAVMIYFWRPGIWAPIFMLVAYNLVHLGMRYTVFLYGLHRGLGVIEVIDNWQLPAVKNAMEMVMAASLAMTVFLLVDYFHLAASPAGYRLVFILLLGLVAGLVWYRIQRNGQHFAFAGGLRS
ncbi:MAG: PTS mannose/fructose/sorbose transporter family subunit IID [Deltaproteobacteria bacterium]|nr:PTS mannose/fructose/sorbose transporter family subunit IID [Deltaproteobacteria bacterium]